MLGKIFGKKKLDNEPEGNLPQVTVYTDKGDIVLELFVNDAPGTVKNFTDLIQKNFYKGLKFHRVIDNFMIQGGCPHGTGTGGPGYTIKCEINKRKHLTGTLSMANRGPDTGGSQFFITHSPQPHLNGKHTIFGHVISGMDVVYKIKAGDLMKDVKITKSI